MAYTIKWEEKGVYLRFYDTLTLDEVRQSNDELYSDSRFYDAKYQVCDYLDVNEINLVSKEVKIPASIDKAASASIPGMKIALISTDNRLIELGNEYIETSKKLHSTWVFNIFECLEDARNWISS